MNKSFSGMTLATGFPEECWIAHLENNQFIYGGSTFAFDLKKYSLSKYQTDSSFIHSKFEDVKRNKRPVLTEGRRESSNQAKLRSQSVGHDKAAQTGVKTQVANSSQNCKILETNEIRNAVPNVPRRNTRERTNPIVNLSQKYSDFLSDILDENNSVSLDLEESLRINSNPNCNQAEIPRSSNMKTSSSSINTNTESKNSKKPGTQLDLAKLKNPSNPQAIPHKASNASNPALEPSEPLPKPISSKDSSHSNLSTYLNQLNSSGNKNDSTQSNHSRALSNPTQSAHLAHLARLNTSSHSIHHQVKSISPTSQSIHSKLGQYAQDSRSILNHSNSTSQLEAKTKTQQVPLNLKRHSIEVRIPSSALAMPQTNQIELNVEPNEFRQSELTDSKTMHKNYPNRRQSESLARSELLYSSKSSQNSSIHKISRSEIAFDQVDQGKADGSKSRFRPSDRSSSQDVKTNEDEVNHWTKFISDTGQDLRAKGKTKTSSNSRGCPTSNPLFSNKSPLEYYHSLGLSSPTLLNPYKKNLRRRKNDTKHYKGTFNSKLRSSYTQSYTYV